MTLARAQIAGDPGTGSGLAGLDLQGTFQPVVLVDTTAEGTYSIQSHSAS